MSHNKIIQTISNEFGISLSQARQIVSEYLKQNRVHLPNSKVYNDVYGMGMRLGNIFAQGGAEQQKGALAALLSGLNASIKIE